MIRRTLASSRYFIAIAALGSFVSAVTLMLYGTVVVGTIVWDTLTAGKPTVTGAKHLAVEFLQLTDVFLLGTTLYIVAIGLYELFVDPGLPVPDWLHIRNLDDLKGKLIQVIVVLLGVTFLGVAVDWDGDANIFDLGVAVAVVVAAFGLILLVSGRSKGDGGDAGDGG